MLSYGSIVVGAISLLACLLPLSRSAHSIAIGVAVIGICGGLLLIKFFNLLFRVPTYTEDDLLLVLNSNWKTTLTLLQELSELKGVHDSYYDAFFREPNLGWLLAALDRLTEKGLAEERIVARPGPVGLRYPYMKEYRITQGGLREKEKALDRRSNRLAIGRLSPQQG